MTRIAVVYYSGFKGNTATLARAFKRGAETVPETEVVLIHTDEVDDHWQTLEAADAIVFGTPTYIGSIAAKFKEFIEKLSGEIWLERRWTNKLSGGFTVSAGRSGDKLSCLQQLLTFATQMGMIWVPLRITGGHYSSEGSEDDLNRIAGYLGVMAQADIDAAPEDAPPPSDFRTTELHGNHIANLARQYRKGRELIAASYGGYDYQLPLVERQRPEAQA